MRRWMLPLAGCIGASAIVGIAGSFSLFGCSADNRRLPTAPEPPVSEPPFGKMVAKINGLPWESTVVARASRYLQGGHEVFLVAGLGDTRSITLLLPSGVSVGST